MHIVSTVTNRFVSCLTTIPTTKTAWAKVFGITLATTAAGGVSAVTTGFVNPIQDFDPPSLTLYGICKPASSIVIPGLLEEIIWRGVLLPTPSSSSPSILLCFTVICIHVLAHPIAAATIWPRGGTIFSDSRFLLLATIVSVGSTASYIVSGGSVWAAALTHAVPVALWRDFWGGERLLSNYHRSNSMKNLNNGDIDH